VRVRVRVIVRRPVSEKRVRRAAAVGDMDTRIVATDGKVSKLSWHGVRRLFFQLLAYASTGKGLQQLTRLGIRANESFPRFGPFFQRILLK